MVCKLYHCRFTYLLLTLRHLSSPLKSLYQNADISLASKQNTSVESDCSIVRRKVSFAGYPTKISDSKTGPKSLIFFVEINNVIKFD